MTKKIRTVTTFGGCRPFFWPEKSQSNRHRQVPREIVWRDSRLKIPWKIAAASYYLLGYCFYWLSEHCFSGEEIQRLVAKL
tara:strand:- start:324 stop:566 length:243 start_codon:yes stop_codon:yes gene_type:complete